MQNDILLQEASVHDIPLIQSIAHPTWRATFASILSAAQIDYMLEMMYATAALEEQITSKGHHFILALESANPIGFASYELHYKQSSVTKIHKIYILPSAQGKGVGKLLMDHIAMVAKLYADKVVSLNVNRENEAIVFYEKYGFQKVGEEDIDIGNGYLMEDFIMEKQL